MGLYYPLTDIVIVHIVYINETTPPPIPPPIHIFGLIPYRHRYCTYLYYL